MKVLITGSSSIIGQAVIGKLLEAGHSVVAYDISEPVDSDAIAVRGDVRNIDDLLAATSGCNAGIHLAALANEAVEADMVSVNLLGVHAFLEVAAKRGFKRVLIAGSAPVHLPPGDFDTSFDHMPVGGDLYDRSKYLQELIARDFHRRGLPVTCLRFGHLVWGDESATLERDASLSELDYCRGGWVDVNDVAAVCVRAIDVLPEPEFRPYNVVGSRSGRERFDVAATEAHFDVRLRHDFAEFEP